MTAAESYHLLEDFGESNLDRYLRDLYTDELSDGMERSDVTFIQTGVEHIVKNLANEVRRRLEAEINEEIATMKRIFPDLQLLDPENSTFGESVIKTGSFYEENLIGSPDDFRCLLVIGEFQCDSELYSMRGYPLFCHKAVNKSMRNVLHKIMTRTHDCEIEASHPRFEYFKNLFQHTNQQTKQHIVFSRVNMDDRDVCRLSFSYFCKKNNETCLKYINVVFETVFRINMSHDAKCVSSRSFMKGTANRQTPKELLNPRQLLINSGLVSFAEIEHHFLTKVLSTKHRKVFTLIKHILQLNQCNKHGVINDDRARESRLYHVTLFELKRCLVFHHYLCLNSSNNGLGTCVLDVLRDIFDGEYTPEVKQIDMRKRKQKRLRKLLEVLKQVELSSDTYDQTEVSKLITPITKKRNVVKAMKQTYHDHDECLEHIKCVILVAKYLFIITVVGTIMYFMLHAITTPRK